jgi:hypothetical protein
VASPDDPAIELRPDQRQALAASWLRRYLGDAGWDVSSTSLSLEHPFIIGPQDGLHVTVTRTESPPWIAAESSDQDRQSEVEELVKRSGDSASVVLRTEEDFGGVVWYTCTLTDEPPNLADGMFFSRMQQLLHTPARIAGWVRLASDILLHFREDGSNLPDGGAEGETILFHPRALIDVYVAVQGPADGPFTRPIANQCMEVVAAICTFALGRPINLPPTVWPVAGLRAELLPELMTRREDTTLMTLARQGIALDMIFHLAVADRDSWRRLLGALLSFDAALRQQREQVATILFIVAAECLTNPFQSWRKKRLTTRFIKFFDALMPDDLNSMVQHGNFEQAFNIVRGSKSEGKLRELYLDRLYELRSDPVHEGLAMAFEGFASPGIASQRRMLVAWFAEWAILRYLQSPCTSLIGRPSGAE